MGVRTPTSIYFIAGLFSHFLQRTFSANFKFVLLVLFLCVFLFVFFFCFVCDFCALPVFFMLTDLLCILVRIYFWDFRLLSVFVVLCWCLRPSKEQIWPDE